MDPEFYYRAALQPISQWFSPIIFTFLGTSLTIITVHHYLDMFRDRLGTNIFQKEEVFDFIVVGAGSAGAVVANRLSEEKNWNVLLLEAGGEPNPLSAVPVFALTVLNYPYMDWQMYSQPQKGACLAMNNQACAWPRGKGLGGSSNLNFLVYMRGHPADFNRWAEHTGDSRWAYDNVLPFFKKSENYEGEWENDKFHSKGGYLRVRKPQFTGLADDFVQAAQEMGYPKVDLNGNYTEGFSPSFYTETDDGRRHSTHRAFIEPIRNRPNLIIYKFSKVHRVLLREKQAPYQAYGVEYERHGSMFRAYARNEVILSAGSVMSPQILMLSGIGPKHHLSAHRIPTKLDLPVGENLQDHISSFVGPFVINKTKSFLLSRDINAQSVDEFSKKGTGPFTSTGIQAAGFVTSSHALARNESGHPDLQYLLLGTGIYNRMPDHMGHSFNIPTKTLRQYFDGLTDKDAFFVINLLSRPKSRGAIRLASSNPNDYPLIYPNYFTEKQDMDALVEGAKKAVEMSENTEIFKSMGSKLTSTPFPGCEKYKLRSDEYWECYHRHFSLTIYHPSGTCAMGKSNSNGSVVDSELRVLGTRGLRVIDASIMPYITIGNTNAPTIMIGEMGANFIKAAWTDINKIK